MATEPPHPLWLKIVLGFQLFFAIVTLGLSAYGLSVAGSYSSFGLNIFTSIATFAYIGYVVAFTFFVPTLYNIYISLGFQAFLAIFWLATFGTLAALAAVFGTAESYNYTGGGYYYRYSSGGLSDSSTSVSDTTKASAALTAFIWVSFVATLVYTTLAAIRQNRDTSAAAPAATEEHKLGAVGGPTPTSYQPVEQYAQQPQYTPPYAAPGAEYPPQQQQFQEQPTGYPPQQFQQPTAYPQQTSSPAPYQQAPVQYPQQAGSPAPYQQAPVQYPQQAGSPAPYQQSPIQHPHQTGSPAPAGNIQEAP
ncbi:hypothetical protein VC83_07163 [Pseudogymnoascus destructans]|uniref:MARVEL domain-containing protein n=2 Tax=Pseudogymnoascus destructans TaxID=655981 RepID=L8FPN5_PSED2|nr:uncharacterized protein VC83_07163 [Pseudogymnoascus destructans]ELR02453.1 hypothetical protein GMDG_05508 [Pseudogymnoascus destructans 20631-21]OAF56607.1 hypothetical protein VC83_07163 [Pseudogymnoascus destructans]